MQQRLALLSLVVGIALILSSVIGPAGASQTGGVTVGVTVPDSGELTLATTHQNGAAGGGAANFNGAINVGGQTENTSAVTATIKSNSAGWTLTQHISAGQLAKAGGGNINLRWKKAPGSYAVMKLAADPDIIDNGGVTGGAVSVIDYAVNITWTDPQGAYEGTVTYTLSY